MTRFSSVRAAIALFAGFATVTAVAQPARAQTMDDDAPPSRPIGSPERFGWELRIGPYQPDVGNDVFEDTFGGDDGLMLATEIDVQLMRIPYLGLFGIGAIAGWARYTADAFAEGGDRTDEETAVTLIPISAVGVLRIDVLAHELGIPFVFTGKLGGEYMIWTESTGTRDTGPGAGWGLRWAAQLALELDFFDRSAARTLDEEWGINHSFIFAEVYGSTVDAPPASGDVTWAGGLGFIF